MAISTTLTQGAPPRRFHELDSLRGLAALTVVFYHFTLICSPAVRHLFLHSFLRILVAGHQAVILFFLLSGFVLTLPYTKSSNPSYGPFVIKRFCRIYLPYLGALILAVICDHFFRGNVINNYWTSQTWSEPITAKLVGQHILFLGNYDWSQFNTAFWSLVYEMRISLFFPLIALVVLRFNAARSIFLAVILSVTFALLAGLLSSLHLGSKDAAFASTITLHYAAFFILGSLLARNLDRVNGWYQRLHLVTAVFLAFAAFLLYCWGNASTLSQRLPFPPYLYDWFVAAGAVMIMILAMNAHPFHAFLNSRLIHHLGKVSYSLYLVHGTVLFTLISTRVGHMPIGIMLVLYLAITLVITEIFYVLIEHPTMLLGRRISARAERALASPMVAG